MTSPAETEQTFLIGQQWNGLYRDRYAYQRDVLNDEAMRAWRLNPLARQITNLYKIYNTDGISFKCDDPKTQEFLMEFWNHELNNMEDQLEQISNEIFLTGTLFELFSFDKTGMCYYRTYPTDQIAEIVTAENDIMQVVEYVAKPTEYNGEGKRFPHLQGKPSTRIPYMMRHETINQLAGTVWGEGEIWPDLPWLGRYASFLEDRVRLNRYRNAFMYVVQGTFKSKEEKETRAKELNRNPPQPGTILVTDPSEQWGIMSPSTDAFDASEDGLAIKKMIMVNNAPMHYAAEPESSTRTTADAAGTPTFKAFESKQNKFKKIILNILKTAVRHRYIVDKSVNPDAKIEIISADATERDNAALALATGQIIAGLGEMYDRELVDESEYIRLVYRFAGETPPEDYKERKGIRKPLNTKPANTNQGGIKTDAETGDVKIKGEQ